MNFNKYVINEISKIMIPRHKQRLKFNHFLVPPRNKEFKNRSEPSKKSAVLIPLCVYRDSPSLLYTKRSNKINYKNEICFPGGYAEKTDVSLLHTALREFHEECGADFTFKIPNEEISQQLNDNDVIDNQPFCSVHHYTSKFEIQILGSLFHSIPGTHESSITPIVSYIHQSKKEDLIEDILIPNKDEVQQAFCIPIDELINVKHNLTTKDSKYETKYGPIDGLTGFLTKHLLYQIFPFYYF